MERGENVLITGATGCGKSYLVFALCNDACSLGRRTLYYNMNRWCEQIAEPTVADVIPDRLPPKAHRIELKSESLRKRPEHLS